MSIIATFLSALIRIVFSIIVGILYVPFVLLGAIFKVVGFLLTWVLVVPLSLIFVTNRAKRDALVSTLSGFFGVPVAVKQEVPVSE